MGTNEWYRDAYGLHYLELLKRCDDVNEAALQAEWLLRVTALPPGASVLDLCCGHGRLAIPLARKGLEVTGVDIHPRALELALKEAQHSGLAVNLRLGDMRDLPWSNHFDLVISMQYSFGYLESEDEDLKVLQSVSRALKPGGQFVLQTTPYEETVRTVNRRKGAAEVGDLLVLESSQFDPITSIWHLEQTIVYADGQRATNTQLIRLYTVPQYQQMFRAAGLEILAVTGDFNGSAYSLDSPSLLIHARKVV